MVGYRIRKCPTISLLVVVGALVSSMGKINQALRKPLYPAGDSRRKRIYEDVIYFKKIVEDDVPTKLGIGQQRWWRRENGHICEPR